MFVASAIPRATLDRYVRDGIVRRLARGLYTSNLEDPAEAVLRRNIYATGGALFPGAVLSERSFVEGGVTRDNELTLVGARDADLTVGEITYRTRRGPGALENDMPWMNTGLHFASPARGLLENARLTRSRHARRARALDRAELEGFLERKLDSLGVEGLNALRDQARALAPRLKLERELQVVEQLIGAILGTRELAARSSLLRARRSGIAYDDERITLFQELRDTLLEVERTPVVALPTDARERHLPFFEAYFSNYIEGTIFTLDEAIGIVYEQRIPQARPQDAHDIIDTFAIVSDVREMTRLPVDGDELLELLHVRHAHMMECRPEARPGEFKQVPNQAGNTVFVHPDRVRGTLLKGFEGYRELADPFSRAVYMMFLVSEVHPFADGNGRIARIMMNAELVAGGEERIIVTPSLREGYVGALRDMSSYRESEPMIRILSAYQRFASSVDFGALDEARRQLDMRHVHDDSGEPDLRRSRRDSRGGARNPEPEGAGRTR